MFLKRLLRLLFMKLSSIGILFFNIACVHAYESKQPPACPSEALYQSVVKQIRDGHWDYVEVSLQNLLRSKVTDCESSTMRMEAGLHYARLLWKRGNIISAETALQELKAKAEQQSQREIIAEINLELAEIAFVRAMLMRTIPAKEAISAYEKSMTYALSADRPDIQSQSLGRLGIVYERTGDPEKGETFYKKALNVAQETGAQDQLHLPLTHIGSILLDRGETEAARSYYTDALAAAQNSSQPEQMIFAYMNYARHAERDGNYSENDALIDVYKANELSHRLGHKIAVTISYLTLASFAENAGDNELAATYAKSALLLTEKHDFKSLQEIAEVISGNLNAQ